MGEKPLQPFELRNLAFNRSRLNRDMLRAMGMIEDLIEVLNRITEFGQDDLLKAWARVGVQHDPDCREQEFELESAERVPEEAAGFRWACGAFLGTLRAEAVQIQRTSRR